MYKVIRYFTDARDGEFPYNVGDSYPREGLEVSGARLRELSTDRNRRHVPLIQKVEEETPKTTSKKPTTRKKKVEDTQ